MQRVIVTVKRQNEPRLRDLDLPAEVEAGRLATLIAQALHWDSDQAGEPLLYSVEAYPLGRVLDPEESLQSAGVWDGSWLVLYPVSAPPPMSPSHDFKPLQSASPPLARPVASAPAQPDNPSGVVAGWRSLGLDLPISGGAAEPEPKEETGSPGYAWKQLDD